jgi:glutamate-1-semialdehyde-2,1-aminomutase
MNTKMDNVLVSFNVNNDIYLKLQHYCQDNKNKQLVVVLTTFKILLWRYTEPEDVIVEVLSAPASLENFETPLRLQTAITNDTSAQTVIERVIQTIQTTLGNQSILSLPVKLALPHLPFLVSQVTTSAELADSSNQAVLNDLIVSIAEQEGTLTIECEYCPQRFQSIIIEQMLRHFQTLLEGVITHPNDSIAILPLLTEIERQQILVDWNHTQQSYPSKCFPQLFEEQVKRTPNTIAVTFRHQQLTYRELNRRANQLAHYLQAQGIVPEVLVGLCIERSLDMLVGLLGILKAGGGYVPLDPTYPQERLAYMLADANVAVLLTHSTLVKDHWPFRLTSKAPDASLTIICLDTDWKRIVQHCVDNPLSEVQPDNLAYIIYTSGSTGQPKGVQISHRALVNFLTSMSHQPGLNEQDVLLAVTTISFDIAGLELYLPLMVGAKLVLASHEMVSSGQLLAKLIKTSGATVMQATPATWYLLLAAHWEGNSRLKVLCGGETLPQELAKRLLDKVNSVWNLYGPTEATIWSTCYEVTRSADFAYQTQSALELIGRPIANTQIYILDSQLQPVPVGVNGELYIGGVGLARGYRHRPELTAERFITNPLVPTERLYKTGDLARYLPDGNIEFLGRIDYQVKVHGFRIELGEIEAVLNRHAGVHQSVVVVQKHQISGELEEDKRLVAYVVPDPHYQADPELADQASDTEQIVQWQQLWDMAYRQDNLHTDPTFNISGWNDSYTGAPIPEPEMREWLSNTVERILSTCQPQRVLEIGCGTGMLLFRIAPHCNYYCGSDIAPAALRYIEEQLDKLGGDWSQVTLHQGSADNFTDLNPAEFDTVIINSVVQLFPNIDYLITVLEQAIQVLKPGGSIFVGDIRNLPLLEAFHASIQLQRVPAEFPKETLRYRIQKSMVQEGQLAINPQFFWALQQQLSRISHVEIQLRQGYYHNEMTKFRYDAILYLDKANSSSIQSQQLDWQLDSLTLPSISKYLAENQPSLLGIHNVPNARLRAEMRLLALLESEISPATAGELRQALPQRDEEGIEPDEWRHFGTILPYTVYLTWSAQQKGCYDVWFQQPKLASVPLFHQTVTDLDITPLTTYANNPLQGKIVSELEPALRRYLKAHLPDYMVPAAFVILEEMPLTPNGKVNRRALPIPESTRPTLATQLTLPQSDTEQQIAKVWQTVLQLDMVGIHDNFFELGGNSLHLTQVYNQLVTLFGPELSVVQLFQYPTIQSLAQQLNQPGAAITAPKPTSSPITRQNITDNEIAIIGLAGRFPGAQDIDTFWQNLCDGVESISGFAAAEIEVPDRQVLTHPNYVKAGAILPDIEQFDAAFFGYSPREAELMDPQHRVLLECAWEALENAGYNPENYQGLIGIYAGSGMNTYLINNIHSNPQFASARTFLESSHNLQIRLANGADFLTTRIAYKLNLSGPSVNIQTACSTSLVAVHQACQSLRHGECDMALAGGISITVPQKVGYLYQEDMIGSPDGHCRAFDAQAQGTVFGSGGGMVVLKRLKQALADGDNIYAIIKGSAINNDGALKVGYTAPSVTGQRQVITAALANAKIDASTITYVEAHGTGTTLGDPIEIAALTQAFRQDTPAKGCCALGSVKTNIGHLIEAAGISGLIKTVLALKHRQLPPSLHFNQPNANIDLANSPFYVNTTLSEWQTTKMPRRAGVSSFGMGGTNAHVIVEEAPPAKQPQQRTSKSDERPWHLLTLSAPNEQALPVLTQRYVNYLDTHADISLADMCFTANTGRKHFEQRLTVIANSTQQLQEQLANFSQLTTGIVTRQTQSQPIAFLFTGQGSQYVGMGQQLYHTQPTFRQVLKHCDEILRPYLNKSLLEVLYPDQESSSTTVNETAYTQPALFALEYALAKLWQSWGIEPDVVMGHSVGEYVAACIAGIFSLEDGLKLIAERGRLIQALPQNGEMVALLTNEAKVHTAIQPYHQEISIAAVNGPESIVISGVREAINSIGIQLESEGIKTRKLNVSHAFHSPLIEPMLEAFEQTAGQITYQTSRIPMISNLTGQILPAGLTLDARYWRRHTRETVKFAEGMNTLFEQGYEQFLEIGPKPLLSTMGKLFQPRKTITWLPSLSKNEEDWQMLLNSLSVLYLKGMIVNWSGFDQGYARQRLPLPTYPFQRKRYWIQEKMPIMDTKMTQPPTTSSQNTERRNLFQKTLRSIIANVLHLKVSEVDDQTSFFEMGADSILLAEVGQAIENTYGVSISLRDFFEKFDNVDDLVTYIDQHLSPEWSPLVQKTENQPTLEPKSQPEPEATTETPASPTTATTTAATPSPVTTVPLNDTLKQIMTQQIQAMSQLMSDQLDVLRHSSGLPVDQPQTKPDLTSKSTSFVQATSVMPNQTIAKPDILAKFEKESKDSKSSSPFGQGTELSTKKLSRQQQQHLEALITHYLQRTTESKRQAQQYRSVFSDIRFSMGFRPELKEIRYPIVGNHYQGARFWDVDGNEYVDITMGFGTHLFGHNAPFITTALENQIQQQDIQIGPQSSLAGEVSELICELTGLERVAFFNSGTEAVMSALRLARSNTKRVKIVIFSGSYHGHSDGTLVVGKVVKDQVESMPMVLGVPPNMADNTMVLPYGDSKSLEIIKQHAQELAAVLVEPVQSRQPNLQPKEFLQQLRQITREADIALIFDEVITGFRIHAGGAQAWFGVEADLATYGKILGGGMPIGVVAGKAAYLDRIDGGMWYYGDNSYPLVETTFAAGTFRKHPLTMATSRAVLQHLKTQGPELHRQLNQRTADFANTLNTYFEQEEAPFKIMHFGSQFRFAWANNLSYLYQPLEMDIFFHHLIEKGVYIWEGRICFLSTAHTDEDIEHIIQAIQQTVVEMREGGFIPDSNRKKKART